MGMLKGLIDNIGPFLYPIFAKNYIYSIFFYKKTQYRVKKDKKLLVFLKR